MGPLSTVFSNPLPTPPFLTRPLKNYFYRHFGVSDCTRAAESEPPVWGRAEGGHPDLFRFPLFLPFCSDLHFLFAGISRFVPICSGVCFRTNQNPDLPFLVVVVFFFVAFFICKELLAFLSVFPSFPRTLRVHQGKRSLLFGFPCRFPAKARKRKIREQICETPFCRPLLQVPDRIAMVHEAVLDRAALMGWQFLNGRLANVICGLRAGARGLEPSQGASGRTGPLRGL